MWFLGIIAFALAMAAFSIGLGALFVAHPFIFVGAIVAFGVIRELGGRLSGD
jgi:hypothetical protein